MTEVLIAMAIFALGFVAVAAIFPMALRLQRRTIQTTTGNQFVHSARSMVLARGFSEDAIPSSAPDEEVFAAPNAFDDNDGGTSPPQTVWNGEDRSYGTMESIIDRTVFWVPLFLDAADDGSDPPATTRKWRVYLFVVRGQGNAVYDKSSGTWANPNDPSGSSGGTPAGEPGVPGVQRIALDTNPSNGDTQFVFTNNAGGGRLVRIGDEILDNNGHQYKVIDAGSGGVTVDSGILTNSNAVTHIWAAHPGTGNRSPFVALIGPLFDRKPGSGRSQSEVGSIQLVH